MAKVELTPLDIVKEKYPHLCKNISRISQKLNQRWPWWPLEGSFDIAVIYTINVNVYTYRADQTTKERKKKRQEELTVLAMFSKEGLEHQCSAEGHCNKDSAETELNFDLLRMFL